MVKNTKTFEQTIARFNPSEGTTNPSLLYVAAQQPAYADIINSTIQYARNLPTDVDSVEDARIERAVEYLAVLFGTEIYRLTGRVATEVDIRHSFNTPKTVKAALRIIELYKAQGVPKEAVRIKISATWEGIQAGRILEREHGVSVLITIVFGMVQAITAAEAGVTCIAPYVGRIGDWFRAQQTSPSSSEEDMGVARVRQMQNYLRKYNHRTQIMGASFRNPEQVKALAGVDLLTIAPAILEKLQSDSSEVIPQVTTKTGKCLFMHVNIQRLVLNDDLQQHKRRIFVKYRTSMTRTLSAGPSTMMLVQLKSRPTLCDVLQMILNISRHS
jgi:transaldolase